MVEIYSKKTICKWQKTRKTCSVLLMFVTMLFIVLTNTDTPLAADHTHEHIVGNIVWEYNILPDTGNIEIASLHAVNYGDIVGSVIIPDTLPVNDVEYPVTSIGTAAFKQSTMTSGTNITSVTIPETVTKIGERAFNGLNLTSITIPNNVKTIGNSAFRECKDLISANIGNSVETIDSYAFMDCTNLGSIDIPDSIQNINSYAFYRCSSLSSATIGKNISTIGAQAFRDCGKLGSVVISNSTVAIGTYSFWNCRKITSITIPCNFDKAQFANNTSVIVDTENPEKFTIGGNTGEILTGDFSYTHVYGEPTYTWSYNESENKWECKAMRTCAARGDVTEEENGVVTGTVTKNPTCISMGETTYTATFTNPYFLTQTKTVEDIAIDPAAHNLESTWVNDEHTHWHTCTLCGAVADQSEHIWGVPEVIREATNKTAGEIKYTCTICGREKTEIIPPSGEDDPDPVVPPSEDNPNGQGGQGENTPDSDMQLPFTGDCLNIFVFSLTSFFAFLGFFHF